MHRKSGVIVSEPASHAHNAGAERYFCERAQDPHGSERSITNAEDDKKREEIEEGCKTGGEGGTAVLDALEQKSFQKNYVQNDVDTKRDGSDDDGCFGVASRSEEHTSEL